MQPIGNAAVFTSILGEDSCWIEQYLREIERLGLPFFVHLDRCDYETKEMLIKHKQCQGFTANNDKDREFIETDKNGIFKRLKREGYKWAIPWDVDETWEADAPDKIRKMLVWWTNAEYIDIHWVNLWEDRHHIRTDGPFGTGHRVKFLNLEKGDWLFRHKVINGASRKGSAPCMKERKYRYDLTCIHHGMITEELRKLHKERWDRIYSKVVGENPYGFWDYALNPNITPTIEPFDG